MRHQKPHERVLDDVGRGVGRRHGNGDYERGGGKSEQAQHQRLATPPWKPLLQHRHAALTERTQFGDAGIRRQRPEQRHQDQYERRQGRQKAGGDERDAWLISQRREVIDAGQAHHLPPGCGMTAPVRPFSGMDPLEQPAASDAGGRGERRHRTGSLANLGCDCRCRLAAAFDCGAPPSGSAQSDPCRELRLSYQKLNLPLSMIPAREDEGIRILIVAVGHVGRFAPPAGCSRCSGSVRPGTGRAGSRRPDGKVLLHPGIDDRDRRATGRARREAAE